MRQLPAVPRDWRLLVYAALGPDVCEAVSCAVGSRSRSLAGRTEPRRHMPADRTRVPPPT